MRHDIRILPGLTTALDVDWRAKVKEIDILGLKEIALFMTGVKTREERMELLRLLKETKLESIPHVHLKDDENAEEIDFLIDNFGTQAFNIHPQDGEISEYILKNDLSDYASMIYVENIRVLPNREDLDNFAGLCIDFAHWENARLHDNPNYVNFPALIHRHKVGCSHISAIEDFTDPHDMHYFENLDEFDYLERYLDYLPHLVSLELSEPLLEQLPVKRYIESMIRNQRKHSSR